MIPEQTASFHVYPLGDAAIVVEFGTAISEDVHKKVRAFAAYLEKNRFPGMIEYVPAFTTVTLFYDPWMVSKLGKLDAYQEIVHTIQQIENKVEEIELPEARLVEIPVYYGDEFGPDLAFVAEHAHLTIPEIIDIHSGAEYLVYMIGFAPGFPYLGGMDTRIAAPRRSSPRRVIPAGSVGIAGNQTGIYPLETPGGWQLIGRTLVSLFDPQRQPPVLLQAGDKVRFVPISKAEYAAYKSHP
ncbi:5-oxoprolinase subunit PxpB [Rhodocytophaga rosea]|uniref:5-oxoprolinase subunit PxpB n=1 Tax=Rhodocytophaga rosea TaxID=2704465 RepID=A0A6C0GH15_9BACT|nr:5-oxoprolinase subunit PxpB [Rhodocytophaga rosea]QHT67257.1 5-oxoprolinase subunit PxpB [Rhodocytophaga rosea]